MNPKVFLIDLWSEAVHHPLWRHCITYRPVVSFIVAVAFIYSLIYKFLGAKLSLLELLVPTGNQQKYADVLNFIFLILHVFVLILMLSCQRQPRLADWELQNQKSVDAALKIANTAVHQFRFFWWVVLGSWCAAYTVRVTVIGLQLYGESENPGGYWPGLILSYLSNLNSVGLYMLLATLTRITVTESGTPRYEQLLLPFTIWLIAAAVDTTLTATIASMEIPGPVKLPHVDSLQKAHAIMRHSYEWVGSLILVMIVGRLDSKLLGVPMSAIAMLYLYPLIACGFDPSTKEIPSQTWMFAAALFLKTLLFVVIEWLLSSGSLLFYVSKIRLEIKLGLHEQSRYIEQLHTSPDELLKELLHKKLLIMPADAYERMYGRENPPSLDDQIKRLSKAVEITSTHYCGQPISLADLIVETSSLGNVHRPVMEENTMDPYRWNEIFGEWKVFHCKSIEKPPQKNPSDPV